MPARATAMPTAATPHASISTTAAGAVDDLTFDNIHTKAEAASFSFFGAQARTITSHPEQNEKAMGLWRAVVLQVIEDGRRHQAFDPRWKHWRAWLASNDTDIGSLAWIARLVGVDVEDARQQITRQINR